MIWISDYDAAKTVRLGTIAGIAEATAFTLSDCRVDGNAAKHHASVNACRPMLKIA